MIETEWFGWRVSILLCDEPQANRYAMPDKVDSVAAQIVFPRRVSRVLCINPESTFSSDFA